MARPEFPAVVHTYTDVLEFLDQKPDGLTEAAIAEATGRVVSNVKRDLHKLVDAGVVRRLGAGWAITPKGERWVDGQKVARGEERIGDVAGGPAAVWPIDRMFDNPDNPERTADPEADAQLAESIVAAKGLLQNLVLSPPDASGARMIWAGHRRRRMCLQLIEEGRLPDSLAGGLPFTESAIDPGIEGAARQAAALKVALIENHNRAGVPPWSDAKALARFAELEGLSARQAAFAIGRAVPGSEKGVADVQQKIKTVRKARPEDVAAHERGDPGCTWEWLRERARAPRGEPGGFGRDAQLSPAKALALVEMAMVALQQDGPVRIGPWTARNGEDVHSFINRGLATGHHGREGGDAISPNDAAWAWLADNDLDPRKNPDAWADALEAAGVEADARQILADRKRWRTNWLNPDFDDPKRPEYVYGHHYGNKTNADEYRRKVAGRKGGAAPPERTPAPLPEPVRIEPAAQTFDPRPAIEPPLPAEADDVEIPATLRRLAGDTRPAAPPASPAGEAGGGLAELVHSLHAPEETPSATPEATPIARLWPAASGAFKTILKLVDGDPVDDDELAGARFTLQMALMETAGDVPKPIREDAQAALDQAEAGLLMVLQKGDVVETGGAMTYELLGPPDRASNLGHGFNVQGYLKGKKHGKPRHIYIGDIRRIVTSAWPRKAGDA